MADPGLQCAWWLAAMQSENAGFGFTTLAGLFAGQVIAAAAGMSLDIENRLSGRSDVSEQGMQDGMLENVGAVTCVIAVLVGEHGNVFLASE